MFGEGLTATLGVSLRILLLSILLILDQASNTKNSGKCSIQSFPLQTCEICCLLSSLSLRRWRLSSLGRFPPTAVSELSRFSRRASLRLVGDFQAFSEIDVMPWLSRGAQEYISQACFGYTFNALDLNRRNEYSEAARRYTYVLPLAHLALSHACTSLGRQP